MLPTPSTSHVDYDHIYEPAEDSYLLLDTFSSAVEHKYLSTRFQHGSPSPLALEVGTGSGVVLAFVTAHALSIFGRRDIATIGVDINQFACSAAAQTVKLAIDANESSGATFLDTVAGDLASSMRPHSVDILIFNPPYVPTEALPVSFDNESHDQVEVPTSSTKFQRDSNLLALSYAGGVDGMETTNRLLAQIPNILSNRGVAYVLLCAQNKPDEVITRIVAWPGGWSAEKIGWSGKKAGWEKLCVVRIWRNQLQSVTAT